MWPFLKLVSQRPLEAVLTKNSQDRPSSAIRLHKQASAPAAAASETRAGRLVTWPGDAVNFQNFARLRRRRDRNGMELQAMLRLASRGNRFRSSKGELRFGGEDHLQLFHHIRAEKRRSMTPDGCARQKTQRVTVVYSCEERVRLRASAPHQNRKVENSNCGWYRESTVEGIVFD